MSKKVLVIQTWGVGNMIQMTPTLRAISDCGYQIDLFVSPVFPDQYNLIRGWPAVQYIYEFPQDEPDFDTYDFLVYHHPARIEKFSRYKELKKSKKSSIIIENGTFDPFWGGEINANLELAVKIGLSPFAPEPRCHVEYDPFDFSSGTKQIVLAPTTHPNKKLWGPKNWHYWNEFIEQVADLHPSWNFWIVGAENDSDIPLKFSKRKGVKRNIKYRIGKLGIKKVAGLIKNADVVICNETGIGWIADALDTPCLTLWTCTNQTKNWMQSKERVAVWSPVCLLQPCHTPKTIPGLFCPYLKQGLPHKCGDSFSVEVIHKLMMKRMK